MIKAKKIAIEALFISLSVGVGLIDQQLGMLGINLLSIMYLLPIFFLKDMFGTKSGIVCLFISSLTISTLFSRAGILDFLIRISAFVYLFFRKKNISWWKILFLDVCGVILTIVAQLPVSYIYYKSLLELDSIKFIIYNVFMDLLNLSIVVIVSRVIKLKGICEKYE